MRKEFGVGLRGPLALGVAHSLRRAFCTLALLAVAIATGHPWLVRAAAAGFVGACAFASFFACVVLHVAGAKNADQVQAVIA